MHHMQCCWPALVGWRLLCGLVVGSPFVARVAMLACIGGLAFVVRALIGFLIAYAFLTIASLCNALLNDGAAQCVQYCKILTDT